MRRMLTCLIACGAIASVTGVSLAQPTGPAQSEVDAARADFESMRREILRIDSNISKQTAKALNEARTGGGQADPETVAQLLSMRDQRDRVFNRMLVLSTRYGFEMPNMSPESRAEENTRRPPTNPFEPLQAQLRSQIRAEAILLATSVRMPVISLDPAISAAARR